MTARSDIPYAEIGGLNPGSAKSSGIRLPLDATWRVSGVDGEGITPGIGGAALVTAQPQSQSAEPHSASP